MAYLGFDIGGTKCAVVLGARENGKLSVRAKRSIPTPPDWREALGALFRAGRELAAGSDIAACGFSCGGPLDAREGLVLSPPNLPGWDHVPLTAMAREAFACPAFLENDANACAIAEWRYGAGRGTANMAFLTFGTGLGAGLILDGRLIRGANGNAGEVGHVRLSAFGPAGYGKEGAFEGFCSGGGIRQLGETLARREQQKGSLPAYARDPAFTAKSIAEAARAGDETAREVYARCAEALGNGLSILADILNPEVIVLGSIFARCEDLLRPGMEAALRRECLPMTYRVLRVKAAELGEAIGDMAALCVAEYGLNAH